MADTPGDPRRSNDCPVFAMVDRRDRAEGSERSDVRPEGQGRAAWDALWSGGR
jgi:hypothetical protein